MKRISQEMQSCIDSCYSAVTSSQVCLDEHMGEPDMKKCHKLCLDTIAIATACASMCAAKSDYVGQVSRVCAQVCRDCADECAKFDSEVCQECAQRCRECADKCEAMAA